MPDLVVNLNGTSPEMRDRWLALEKECNQTASTAFRFETALRRIVALAGFYDQRKPSDIMKEMFQTAYDALLQDSIEDAKIAKIDAEFDVAGLIDAFIDAGNLPAAE